jgi:hypothetical protein
MSHRSPTLEGFRAVFRLPSLGLAELAWRWSFGAAACLLLGGTFLEYLDTLAVTPADLLLLRSRQPFLIGRAFTHILAGSGPRLVYATLVLLLALVLAWIVTASVGRAATLRALLGRARAENWRLRALLGLNFLRVGLALAAVLGFGGAAILAGFTSSDANPQTGLAFLLFAALALAVWSLWSLVNWFLSLAAIFVVRDGRDTFAALADAVGLCRDHFGPVLASGSWFALIHGLFFAVATVVACFPLALATALPGGVTFFLIFLITLSYFAVVDYLYVARLAAYVYIVEDSHQPPAVPLPPLVNPPSSSTTPEPEFDPDDLILSDHN